MATSSEKIRASTAELEEALADLVASPGDDTPLAARMALTALKPIVGQKIGQLADRDPEEIDDALARLIAWAARFRSDGARPIYAPAHEPARWVNARGHELEVGAEVLGSGDGAGDDREREEHAQQGAVPVHGGAPAGD